MLIFGAAVVIFTCMCGLVNRLKDGGQEVEGLEIHVLIWTLPCL